MNEVLSQHDHGNCELCDEQEERIRTLEAEVERLKIQAERPKCMYCTFGEDADFSIEDLKQHIETECDFHPLRKLKRDLAELSEEMTDLQVAWQQQAERAIRAEARVRVIEERAKQMLYVAGCRDDGINEEMRILWRVLGIDGTARERHNA